jgi:hypothetical protein
MLQAAQRANTTMDKGHKAQTTNGQDNDTTWKGDGSNKLRASIANSWEDGPRQTDTMCHALETNHSPIYMFAYVVRPNWDAAALLSNR